MAHEGSQQLRARDPAPARRCGAEGRTGHRGQEGGNGNGNRDGCGDGNEDEDGNVHGDRDCGGNEDESGEEGGGERETGDLQSEIRGGSEDTLEGATPRSNQQPQPQDPFGIVASCKRPELRGDDGRDRGQWRRDEEVQEF